MIAIDQWREGSGRGIGGRRYKNRRRALFRTWANYLHPLSPASLLPFCYPTAQYGAGQGSIRRRPMLENSQLFQTYQDKTVGDVIAIAEL
jgi:hypothetical protein